MRRDARAYLSDIIDACRAIQAATAGADLTGYEDSRIIRSAVEREFIIVGEALSALSRDRPDLFEQVSRARRIVDFRNQLTHAYPTVDNALVWAIIQSDVERLLDECAKLLERSESARDEA